MLDNEYWLQVDEKLFFHRLTLKAGVDIKYAYEDPEAKQKHWKTPPGHSHINTPSSPNALALFHKQSDLGAERLEEEQAPATVIGQAATTLHGWAVLSRMSKFRASLSNSRDLHFLAYLPAVPVHYFVVPLHHGP